MQAACFLVRPFSPLLKTGLPLTNNVIMPLTKTLLITFGLTAAALPAEIVKHKNSYTLEGKHQ